MPCYEPSDADIIRAELGRSIDEAKAATHRDEAHILSLTKQLEQHERSTVKWVALVCGKNESISTLTDMLCSLCVRLRINGQEGYITNDALLAPWWKAHQGFDELMEAEQKQAMADAAKFRENSIVITAISKLDQEEIRLLKKQNIIRPDWEGE